MLSANFDAWSVTKAFTRDYYPDSVECCYCKIPRKRPHLCVFEKGELVKMQPCERQIMHLSFYKKYKNYVCESCFVVCNPSPQFVKIVKKSMKYILDSMLKRFDKNFTCVFLRCVLSYLLQKDALLCVRCGMNFKDYRGKTYSQIISSHRKRRLEI